MIKFSNKLNLKSPSLWLMTLIGLGLSLIIVISLTIITNIVVNRFPFNAWLIGGLFLLIILGSLTYQILFNFLNVNWNPKTDLMIFNTLLMICSIYHLTIDLILIINIDESQIYYLVTIPALGLMLNMFAITSWINMMRRYRRIYNGI